MPRDYDFPAEYADGRRRFLELATAAGFILTPYTHPTQCGPNGDSLACDVARRGPALPRSILLISSGTHGVEGFCGSGVQAAILNEDVLASLPPDIAIVLVHAVNPYGFAWLRRTNEDNVDLNRNFVDHDREYPNPSYDEIHGWLIPADWDGPARVHADAQIAHYIETRGLRTFQQAVTGGQYTHADGLFYGGRSPAWSNLIWRRVLQEHCDQARHIVAIDVHTGLGPSGVGEAICLGSETHYQRAKSVFGDDVVWMGAGQSISADVGGTLVHGAIEVLGEDRLTMIGLEYGTHPIPVTLEALRAETWLSAKGNVNTTQGKLIKQALRDAFYVDTPEWRRAVVERLLSLLDRVRSQMP